MPDAASLIHRVRGIALALDGATEKLSHGAPTFFVRGRTFAMIDDHHHGADHRAVYVNAPEGVQRSLVEGDPEHFFIPPYVGKAGWIGVRIDRALPWDVIAELVRQAHAVTGIRKKSGRRAL